MSSPIPSYDSLLAFMVKSRPLYWLSTIKLRGQLQPFLDEPLTPLQQEQIATYVSMLNGCNYCSLSHRCDIEVLGGDGQLIQQAVEDLETAPLDEKLRSLLRFVRSLAQEPAQFGEADWRQALAAGWQADELQAAIYTVGWFQLMNTIATGNLIPATTEEKAMDLARSRQSSGGYGEVLRSLEHEIGKHVEVMLTVTDAGAD